MVCFSLCCCEPCWHLCSFNPIVTLLQSLLSKICFVYCRNSFRSHIMPFLHMKIHILVYKILTLQFWLWYKWVFMPLLHLQPLGGLLKMRILGVFSLCLRITQDKSIHYAKYVYSTEEDFYHNNSRRRTEEQNESEQTREFLRWCCLSCSDGQIFVWICCYHGSQ